MYKNILKHNFTEPKDEPTIIGGYNSVIGSQYSTIDTITDSYAFIGGGTNNNVFTDSSSNGHTTIGGGYGNETTTTISRDPIGTEEFRASAVFTNDMAHTTPREEITVHLKRQIMQEVFESMVRSDMFEFWTNVDTSSFGEQINCRLKVVRPQN